MRVLVADRDPVFTLALGRYFERKGWEITTASDAARALDRAGTPPRPDLIVLDLDLSGGEGMTLLQLLKTAPSTGLIPVVTLSASDDANLEQVARSCGAARFARKPIDPSRFGMILGPLVTPGVLRAHAD